MPLWKMRIGGEVDGEAWEKDRGQSLNGSTSVKHDASLIEPRLIKRVQAVGWLRQQALLGERKLNPDGILVKQRLFSFDSIPLQESRILATRVSRQAKHPSQPHTKRSIGHAPAQQMHANAASTLTSLPGASAAAERSTVSAHPDVAEVPQIETCPSSIAELAVNAGLSKHLSELESRVEALHQSAEELGSSCLASNLNDTASFLETDAGAHGSRELSDTCACNQHNGALVSDAEALVPNIEGCRNIGKITAHPAAEEDHAQPALPDVKWWQDASSANGAHGVKGLQDQVDWTGYYRAPGGRKLVAAIADCTAQLAQLERDLGSRKGGPASHAGTTWADAGIPGWAVRATAWSTAGSPLHRNSSAARARDQQENSGAVRDRYRQVPRARQWRIHDSTSDNGIPVLQFHEAHSSLPSLSASVGSVPFKAKPVPGFIRKEAEEHRKRKAQLADEQKRQKPSKDSPHEHSPDSPVHGTTGIPWWPGERVIGGGPWSKLPRWRPNTDSHPPASPSCRTTAGPCSMQASREAGMHLPSQPESSQRRGQSHGHQAAGTASPRQCRQHGVQQDRPQSAPSLSEGSHLPGQLPQHSKQSASPASHPYKQEDGGVQSHRAQTSSKHHPPLRLGRDAQGAVQQQRSVASRAGDQEQGRIVYVQRPSAQQPPRRAGSVPNFKELHAKWDTRLADAKTAMQRRLTVPKAFHLSKGSKKVVYVWADKQSEHLHDRAMVQPAELDQALSLDSDQLDTSPAIHASPASHQHSAASSPETQPVRRRKPGVNVQHGGRTQTIQAKQGRLQPKDQTVKAVHMRLSVDGLSEETITRMLAVHARTRRRAESLIHRVQTLRTGCREVLDAMPQHVFTEA